MTTLAYHGDASLKRLLIVELAEHRRFDRFIKGDYWRQQDSRGCAVGCSIESLATRGLLAENTARSDHFALARVLGWPVWLARLEDSLFERLPKPEHLDWPGELVEAIEPGADLSGVFDKFLLDLLTAPDGGVCRTAARREKTRQAVAVVAGLFKRHISGSVVPTAEWQEARRSAADAAYAADTAYAADAADAAAYAAADAAAAAAAAAADAAAAAAAADAADAAADAAAAAAAAADAAAYAARSQETRRQRDVLLRLLREAPVPGRDVMAAAQCVGAS